MSNQFKKIFNPWKHNVFLVQIIIFFFWIANWKAITDCFQMFSNADTWTHFFSQLNNWKIEFFSINFIWEIHLKKKSSFFFVHWTLFLNRSNTSSNKNLNRFLVVFGCIFLNSKDFRIFQFNWNKKNLDTIVLAHAVSLELSSLLN